MQRRTIKKTMNIGFIGLANSGKTTIFNALTKSQAQVTAYAGSKSEPNKAVVDVADSRVAALSDMYKPKKTTYAGIELTDFAGLTEGSAKEGLFSDASMGLIRNTHALAIVVRNFHDEQAGNPTPLSDMEKIDGELLISDLIVAENRLERIEKAYKQGKRTNLLETEEKVLCRIVDHLNDNRPIRELEMEAEHERIMRGFRFLTQKPTMIVLNSEETNFGKNQELLEEIGKNYKVIEFAGKFEMELSRLNDQGDIDLFMADMGIEESARARLCRAAYELLGYISFFTVGSDEVRAWSIQQGETAVAAAGSIHTDLARGFIRAESISYSDLIEYGSEKGVSAKGLLRVEGKNYIVQDGDILNIRFNV
jgi:ribosome-binding ATPase